LQVHGDEAGNSAADASIQALGGYGYTHEYMVEKIKPMSGSPQFMRHLRDYGDDISRDAGSFI